MIGARGFSDLLRATEGGAGVYFGERRIAPGELGIAGDHSPHGLDGRQSILANESPRVEVDVAQVVRMLGEFGSKFVGENAGVRFGLQFDEPAVQEEVI